MNDISASPMIDPFGRAVTYRRKYRYFNHSRLPTHFKISALALLDYRLSRTPLVTASIVFFYPRGAYRARH